MKTSKDRRNLSLTILTVLEKCGYRISGRILQSPLEENKTELHSSPKTMAPTPLAATTDIALQLYREMDTFKSLKKYLMNDLKD